MSKILLLIDTNIEKQFNTTFNNIVFPDNLGTIINKYGELYNKTFSTNDVTNLKTAVNKFYETQGQELNTEIFNALGITPLVLDDDEVCIPSTNPSFLFEIQKNNDEKKEFFAVEKNIGGYSIDTYMDDMPFTNIQYKNSKYSHGTHVGYTMTDNSSYSTQVVTCYNGDGSKDIIKTYKIFCW